MERTRQPTVGIIEIICGPMFSGKTEELIKRLTRSKIAKKNTVVFKPIIDKRFDEIQVVSHSDQKIVSIPVKDTDAIKSYLQNTEKPIEVIGIDEAQFFDNSIVQFVEQLANSGLRVVLSGLDQDFEGKPFGPMPLLLAAADVVTKQYAICIICGAPASKSHRVNLDMDNNQILVGGMEIYEARCRACLQF